MGQGEGRKGGRTYLVLGVVFHPGLEVLQSPHRVQLVHVADAEGKQGGEGVRVVVNGSLQADDGPLVLIILGVGHAWHKGGKGGKGGSAISTWRKVVETKGDSWSTTYLGLKIGQGEKEERRKRGPPRTEHAPGLGVVQGTLHLRFESQHGPTQLPGLEQSHAGRGK